MIRVESHALGPRCFVAGLRVHEWHLGLATLVAAVAPWQWMLPPCSPPRSR